MGLTTLNHSPGTLGEPPEHAGTGQRSDASTAAPDAKPARGFPGSFDQLEPNPDVMPREGGPHPEQTAEVPLGWHGISEPPGARGHNGAPVKKKPGDKSTE